MNFIRTPKISICLGIFLAAFILQWGAISYLTNISKNQFHTETQKLKTQIAQDLANQLSRAMVAEDDLAALSILKESRTIHPQLQMCEIFEKNGKVILHSNPNKMNKNTSPYKGPRPVSPEVTQIKQSGRLMTTVLVPVVHDDDLYFRAFFDEMSLIQDSKSFAARFYILILTASILLSAFAWLRLSRYELLDPRQRADLTAAQAKQKPDTGQHIADLLLSEMRHAALSIGRDNKIIAANSLALELLNCRSEELTGMHIMQSPLAKPLIDFYQTAIKQPGQVKEERLALASKGPALPVKIVFTPAGQNWEMAVISLA